MRVISIKKLREFWEKHADAENELRAWFKEAERADWCSFMDIRRRYKDADAVGQYVVFNICRNRYRLTVKVSYRTKFVLIIYVDTHAAYDKRKLKWDVL